MVNFYSRTPGKGRSLPARLILCAILLSSTTFFAQSTPGTAGIRGAVFDQNGAPVAAAKVTITNQGVGAIIQVTTSSAGIYSSGPLLPGDYTVRVEAKGFKKSELAVVARVAVVSGGDFKLQPGAETEI